MIVEKNKVVSIYYSLMDINDNLIDSNEGYAPLIYLQGTQNIIPGMEDALEGMKIDDQKEFIVTPDQGYGERDAGKIYSLPANEGTLAMVTDDTIRLEDGREAMIQSRNDDTLTINENHPLAGMTLHVKLKVVSIREATQEERLKGFPVSQSSTSCCIPGSGCC